METQLIVNQNLDNELTNEFKELADDIYFKLKKEDLTVRPYLPNLPIFRNASLSKKQRALDSLRFYQQLCNEQLNDGYRIADNQKLVWRAIAKLGYTPTSDLFNFIDNDDVVEIYAADSTQIFRNFNFFEFVSYTLEELHINEWYLLFDRDPQIIDKILSEGGKSLRAEVHQTYDPEIPIHVIRETSSVEKLSMTCHIKRMAPVFNSNFGTGCIVLEKVKSLAN